MVFSFLETLVCTSRGTIHDPRHHPTENKVCHIVASLQPEYAQEIRDLLISPPQEQPYDKLKVELVQRTSASEQKGLHRLLISEEFGDRYTNKLF